MQTCPGWEAGGEEELEQRSVSAGCAAQLIQHSKKLTQKGFTDLTKTAFLVPERRGQSSLTSSPVSTGSYWEAVLQELPNSQLLLLQKALKMRVYNPTLEGARVKCADGKPLRDETFPGVVLPKGLCHSPKLYFYFYFYFLYFYLPAKQCWAFSKKGGWTF